MELAPYFTHLLIVFSIFGILTLGFALTLGWLGISNLSHVAFAGVGAYTTAVLTTNFGVPVWIGVVLGTVAGIILSLVVAALVRRVRGDFVVVVSLGLQFVVLAIAQNWTSVTRGTLGIPGIPRPEWFGELRLFILPTLFLFVATYLLLQRVTSSRFGSLMALVRDDEVAAQALGKNTARVKVLGLLLAGAIGGLAGALAAHYFQYLDPESLHLPELVFVISATILGGLGSLPGALAGTAILFFVPEALRFLALPPEYIGPLRQIIFSVVLLAVLILRPRGLFGKISL